jgi:hypothetical protein
MKPIPEGFELADEPQPLVMRFPGWTLAIVSAALSISGLAATAWFDNRQRPQFEEIQSSISKLSHANQQLATFQLETARHSDAILSLIADSANIKIPPRPKVLDRAEDRVRDIQEGAN